MKLSIFFLSIFFSASFLLIWNQPVQAQNKRLLILLDQKGIEKIDGLTSGTTVLGLALHQKAASILTSYSMLKTYLEIKYGANPYPPFSIMEFSCSDWNIYALKNSNLFFLTPRNNHGLIFNAPAHAYGQDLYSYEKIQIKEKDIAQNIQITKEIIMPLIKVENLEPFLQTPQDPTRLLDWITSKAQPTNNFNIEQLESLIFNRSDFKKNLFFWDEFSFIDTIQSDKFTNKEMSVSNLKNPKLTSHKMQAEAREIEQAKYDFIQSMSTPWNIYLFGHGSYERPPVIQKKGNITYTTYSLASVADLSVGNPKLPDEPNQLTPFLLFFNKINTNLLALSSCYSGGKNLNYLRFKSGLHDQNIPLLLNYPLAVISVTDAPSTSSAGWNWSTETITSPGKKPIVKTSNNIDFTRSINTMLFFELLEGTRFVKKKATAKAPIIRHQISRALIELSGHTQQDSPQNIPQILIPGLDWFQAWEPRSSGKNIHDVSFTLGKAALQKARIEAKPLKISQKKSILVYEELITAPLEISPLVYDNQATNESYRKKFAPLPNSFTCGTALKDFRYPIIISMNHGQATHIFGEIDLVAAPNNTIKHSGILSFLRDAFCNTLDRLPRKTFFIYSLKGFNDIFSIMQAIRSETKSPLQSPLEKALVPYQNTNIELKNVIIDTWGESTNYVEIFKSVITIAFQVNGTFWQFSFNDVLRETNLDGSEKTTALKNAQWNFKQLSEQAYNNLKNSMPNLSNLLKKFAQFEAPVWKITPPKKLSPLEMTLQNLHQRLVELKKQLQELRTKLKNLKKKIQ